MFRSLPNDAVEFKLWPWSKIEPYFSDLLQRSLNQETMADWLADWSQLSKLVDEAYWRLYVAQTRDTTDPLIEQQFTTFVDEVQPKTRAQDQKLREKLLASGLEPPGYEVALRNLRAQTNLFRESNLALLSEEKKLVAEHDRLTGAQTVSWEGQELTILQLYPVLQEHNRTKRERAWMLAAERQLADRQEINKLWEAFLKVRLKLAENADLPDYRSYRWRELLRFDYTPQDCIRFQDAIAEVVVPAASRLYEKRRKQLGVDRLRPWDLDVDPFRLPPLRPYKTIAELVEKTQVIFNQVDPILGEYFAIMRNGDLLDLDNRKGKAPGAYSCGFAAAGVSFVYTNAVGIHDDVQTLLHEGGHAFHNFECNHLPFQLQEPPLEFCEVASMSMELLGSPYITREKGGFYTAKEAAQAKRESLERSLLFWPYMAVVDAFQQWVYENPMVAFDPTQCDEKWAKLWQRFMPDVDWSGLEQFMATGWQRKAHICQDPFYYIEYGLAQLGATQIWHNALKDQHQAVADYRKALALGSSVPLPELYATAGAKLSFDAPPLREAVELILTTIEGLESQLQQGG